MEPRAGAGRIAAYAAALALFPYLLIKAAWVSGALTGVLPIGKGFGLAEWVVLATVTAVMAGTGISLALALAPRWGIRIPAVPVAFCARVDSGFLVALVAGRAASDRRCSRAQ